MFFQMRNLKCDIAQLAFSDATDKLNNIQDPLIYMAPITSSFHIVFVIQHILLTRISNELSIH